MSGFVRWIAVAACACQLVACGGQSVDSAREAERVVTRVIGDDTGCGSARRAAGRVVCKERSEGWECQFGITDEGYLGSAFVPRNGDNVRVLSIC